MLRTLRRSTVAVLIVLAVMFTASCTRQAAQEPGAPAHKAITQELIRLVDSNAEVRQFLEASIAEAKKVNPDSESNPVQTLDAYYDFVDRASELIPSDVLANPVKMTKEQVLQNITYFYFLVDQSLPQLENRGLFKPAIQYFEPFSAWLRSFANSWGSFLDTPASWSPAIYQKFYDDPAFGLQTDWYESPDKWHTFNEFFARHLSSPAARPVASPDNPRVVASPADSVPQGTWAVDGVSQIKVEGGLKVKEVAFFSITELVGPKNPYATEFAGGVLTHTFLNVNDYHRYHFAVGGTVKHAEVISANVALEVSWDAGERKYVPVDSTGWQFSQTRGVVIVDTGDFGLVALIPMGMAQVSSVNFGSGVKPGQTFKKGDELGNFLFGGSDFVMVFQPKAGFALTAPAEAMTPTPGAQAGAEVTYQHILQGSEYGAMKG